MCPRALTRYGWHFALLILVLLMLLWADTKDNELGKKVEFVLPINSDTQAILSLSLPAQAGIVLPAPPPVPAAANSNAQIRPKKKPEPDTRPVVKPSVNIESKVALQVKGPGENAQSMVENKHKKTASQQDHRKAEDRTTSEVAALAAKPSIDDEQRGRLWLTQLENGDGPDIVFSWPRDKRQREWLQQRLYGCGVRLGKWQNGRLSAIEPGVQTVSGFVRVMDGALSVNERQRLNALPGKGQGVRLFTRDLDIKLLAGMSALDGNGFLSARVLRAQYQRRGEAVVIHDIHRDGQRFKQSVELLPGNGLCR